MFSLELIILRDPDLSRKTQRKISFKMRVLWPSETVWGPSYEGFSVHTLFLTSSLWYYNENIMMITSWGSLWGHFEWFWKPSGSIFGPFWAHLDLKSRLGGSMRILFWTEVHFPSSWPAILEEFGSLWGRFLEICFYLFWIWILQWVSTCFWHDFLSICIPSG